MDARMTERMVSPPPHHDRGPRGAGEAPDPIVAPIATADSRVDVFPVRHGFGWVLDTKPRVELLGLELLPCLLLAGFTESA